MEILSFNPIFKEKVWGGDKIYTILGKDFSPSLNCGETWELIGIDTHSSVVANGKFEKKNLYSLVKLYKEKLVGKKNYERFGNTFPLLIKFIDARENLSVQVHPNDNQALKTHGTFGKTEFWYILDTSTNAQILYGFNQNINKKKLVQHIENNTIEDILKYYKVQKGDTFFIPSGKVHAIGGGVLLAEIQQASDITYRIYDYNRPDKTGHLRELHIKEALKAINFEDNHSYYKPIAKDNENSQLCTCDYFKINFLNIKKEQLYDYQILDSFIIYICVEGKGKVINNKQVKSIKKGEVLLLPATINKVKILPKDNIKILECYI